MKERSLASTWRLQDVLRNADKVTEDVGGMQPSIDGYALEFDRKYNEMLLGLYKILNESTSKIENDFGSLSSTDISTGNVTAERNFRVVLSCEPKGYYRISGEHITRNNLEIALKFEDSGYVERRFWGKEEFKRSGTVASIVIGDEYSPSRVRPGIGGIKAIEQFFPEGLQRDYTLKEIGERLVARPELLPSLTMDSYRPEIVERDNPIAKFFLSLPGSINHYIKDLQKSAGRQRFMTGFYKS